MAENILQKFLLETFPLPDIESWKQLAISEADGHDLEKINWSDADGNKFLPYYTRQHVSSFDYLDNFNKPPSLKSYLGNCEWFNMPQVAVKSEDEANRIALSHLSSGADGILFAGVETSHSLERLLKDIEWEFCRLSFIGIENEDLLELIFKYVSAKKIDPSVVSGNMYWNMPSQNFTKHLNEFKNFGTLGIYIPPATAVQEIASSLRDGVQILKQANSQEQLASVLPKISFSIPIDTNFLIAISKIKALRLLWFQIARAFGLENYQPGDLHIHCRSEKWIHEKFQPHENMIKSTTAAMAAVIGGCNSLTVVEENGEIPVMSRVARNVSNILREESYFDKVADPLAGSHVIAQLTNTLADQAWTDFQKKLKA